MLQEWDCLESFIIFDAKFASLHLCVFWISLDRNDLTGSIPSYQTASAFASGVALSNAISNAGVPLAARCVPYSQRMLIHVQYRQIGRAHV